MDTIYGKLKMCIANLFEEQEKFAEFLRDRNRLDGQAVVKV